ncbi:hypothetical protein AYO20_02836 [Fonsecaea nubica]|uniref:Uncharacterized protein n=1 Tax=Fonsecaea nubica TaxID=856822 RepID=A0A178D9V0_9EURO|nr:hypothetical protein AYO20_02836 [Fonsecaea nubica]OAL38003.1 hypothetical protein AYO20_02836 [Fonsecaea nubica]
MVMASVHLLDNARDNGARRIPSTPRMLQLTGGNTQTSYTMSLDATEWTDEMHSSCSQNRDGLGNIAKRAGSKGEFCKKWVLSPTGRDETHVRTSNGCLEGDASTRHLMVGTINHDSDMQGPYEIKIPFHAQYRSRPWLQIVSWSFFLLTLFFDIGPSSLTFAKADINNFLDDMEQGPSAVFAVFFAVSCAVHIWQSSKYKCWETTWPLPFACIVMTAGFICREVAAHDHDADGEGSAIQGLFYSATPIFTLPLYMLLLLYSATVAESSWPRPNLTLSYVVIWTFFSAVISCTAQGASTYFNPDASTGAVRSALALLKASLFLQLAPNAAFLYVLLRWLWSLVRRRNGDVDVAVAAARHRPFLSVLLALMALVCVRNVFRTVQLFVSPRSPLWTAEAYFWVFEGAVMLGYTVLFHVAHPGRLVPTGLEDYRRQRRCS